MDNEECDHDYDLVECRQEGSTAIEVWKCNKCGLENEWVVDIDY